MSKLLFYKTRIAPSPTGDMHIGTARTAYFNWLAARSTGGIFILRIDDTDINRSNPKFTNDIVDAMNWLGLNYDSIIYQSKRFDLYTTIAKNLLNKGLAKLIDGAIILFPTNIPDFWIDDLSGKIKITDDDKNCINQGIVLIKSDGSPTYHFASVVDDIDTGINYIIRGKDHITNTSRHIAIYTSLGISPPKFSHIGLIRKDGKKLSKRDGASGILSYRDLDYHPDAMLNFMARLGWGPTIDDKTTLLLPKNKMLDLFINGGKMKNSDANMDMAKLDFYNKKYKNGLFRG